MSLSFSVLRYRDFRLLLLTRMFSIMAWMAQAVIVGWQVYTLTKDPFMLGLVGLTEAVPAIACALFSGHVVDHSRPHRVFTLCIGLLVLNMLTLLVVAGGMVRVSNVLVWIFAGVFLSGVLRSFIAPSAFSLLPQLVPRADIPAASAWFTSFFQIAAVTGPAVAGLIYGGYGVRAAWMMPAVLMTASFLMLIGMSAEKRAFRADRVREPALKSIREGWRYIFTHRTLLSVMALDMFAVLFGGAVAMLPAFADQVLHVGSEGLGALRAAPALGAGLTALLLAVKPMKHIRVTSLLWAVAGFGVCMIGFGLSTMFWLSLTLLAVSGVCDSVSMVIRATLMQLLVPEHMRGRISSINSMFIISSNEIGAFESGTMARLMGLVPSVLFGGVMTLAVVGFTARIKKFRQTVVSEQ